MSERVESGAVAAWAGPMTCEQIAKALRTSVDTVRRVWRNAIAAGDLPNEPRPHFVERTARPAPASADDFDRDPGEISERDNAANSAALLAALEKHHGDDPRRLTDDMTIQLAQAEAEREDANRALRKAK
jgi:hypothetical protein